MTTIKPEHKEIAESQHEVAEQLSRRVSLWIAVANGAGLAAAGNKVIDKEAVAFMHLLLPACWAFAIGLVAAVVFNFTLMAQARYLGSYWETTDPAKEAAHKKNADDCKAWIAASLLVAAAGFLFGLFFPLVAVSLRLAA